MVEWVQSLLKLQDLDLEVAKLQAQLAAIPAKEEETKTLFKAEEDAFAAAKKSVQEIELTIRKLEGEINTLKTQKENFQSKTSLIKNNDEYRAALLQIEQCDKAISVAEEKQLIAMDELEAAKKIQAEKDASLKAAKKNAEGIFAKLEAEKSADPHAKAQGWKTSVGHPDTADLADAKDFAMRTDKKLTYFLKKDSTALS